MRTLHKGQGNNAILKYVGQSQLIIDSYQLTVIS